MIKLMIVEDEPLERLALRKIVQREFYQIEIVEDAINGQEAIEKAKIFRPDVILMDIRMPEITGIEAQKRIFEFLPNVKSIILTAYSDFKYAQEAIKYGVFDYLLKPAKPDDIKLAIDKAIDSTHKHNSHIITNNNKFEQIGKSGHKILFEAIEYIECNYAKELRLSVVADLIHMNPQYFSRLFKKEIGVTFTEYVTKLRIEKAKRMLIDSDMPIFRIAVELGFSDATYFSKVFLKSEHQSPFEYKKAHRILV